jgi:hypothetical protein
VQPGTHLDAQSLHSVTNCFGATDRSLRAVEHREETVARCVHLTTTETSELRTDDGIVLIKQVMPVAVADRCGPARRIHDVGEQQRGKNPIIGHFCLLPGEELGDLLEGRAPRVHEVVQVAPRQRHVLGARNVVSDVLTKGVMKGSSVCRITTVGTRTVGSTARTSISAVRGIMSARVRGLAASRYIRAHVARISSFQGMSGLIRFSNSPVPHMAAIALTASSSSPSGRVSPLG